MIDWLVDFPLSLHSKRFRLVSERRKTALLLAPLFVRSLTRFAGYQFPFVWRFNKSLACSRLQDSGENGSKKKEKKKLASTGFSLALFFSACALFSLIYPRPLTTLTAHESLALANKSPTHVFFIAHFFGSLCLMGAVLN